ncbi:MAG: cell wall-active antibiotics response protein [Alistipes sp.]|nr:cell wall-active antibiotics response protein [Alistipes sp.]
MEINENGNNNSGARALLSVAILMAGVALLGWSLSVLPTAPAHGFPWEITLAVVSLLPVAAGARMLASAAERRKNRSYRGTGDGRGNKGVAFALLFIAAGALLVGFNTGALAHEWKRVFFSWQMLLLVISMIQYSRGHFTNGSVLLAVGGFFIVRRLSPIYPDIAHSGVGDTFWPVLLIVAGVLILGGVFFKPRASGWYESCRHGLGAIKGGGPRGSRASGVVGIEVIFGGCEQVYLDPVFRGGSITTIFGGVNLDLRRTSLPEGETFLKVETLFGGVEIDAPDDWEIEIRGESIFGGFSDRRPATVDPDRPSDRKLIINASSIFGGGEIK